MHAAFDYNYTSSVIHVVKLTGLVANTTYYYKVGDENVRSQQLTFKTPPVASNTSFPIRCATPSAPASISTLQLLYFLHSDMLKLRLPARLAIPGVHQGRKGFAAEHRQSLSASCFGLLLLLP